MDPQSPRFGLWGIGVWSSLYFVLQSAKQSASLDTVMQGPMCLFIFYYYKFVWIQSKSVLIVCKYYCKSKLFNIKENLFSKANKNSISKNCLGITILNINVQGERKISGRDGSSKGNIRGDTCLNQQQSTNQNRGFLSLTNKRTELSEPHLIYL